MTTPDRNARLAGCDDHAQRVYLMLLEMGDGRFYSADEIREGRIRLGDSISDYRVRSILHRLDDLGLVESGSVAGQRGRTLQGWRAVGERIL